MAFMQNNLMPRNNKYASLIAIRWTQHSKYRVVHYSRHVTSAGNGQFSKQRFLLRAVVKLILFF